LAKTPGASDAMFLLPRSRKPEVAEQDPAEDTCKASSSEKVHPPNVVIWVRVAVGRGVEVAIAVVAALLLVANTQEQTCQYSHAQTQKLISLFHKNECVFAMIYVEQIHSQTHTHPHQHMRAHAHAHAHARTSRRTATPYATHCST